MPICCCYVNRGLTSPLHLVHIPTVPACSSGTLTNVLPYLNIMPHTRIHDMTPIPSQCTDPGHDTHTTQCTETGHDNHPVTVYRHRTGHHTPSQYTDTGHDTPPRHNSDAVMVTYNDRIGVCVYLN